MQVMTSRDEEAVRAARHNIPLDILAQDQDERYRPSDALRALVEAGDIKGFHLLDRSLVPVLNALVDKGMRTHLSCEDGFILIHGVSEEASALLEVLQARLEGAGLEWAVFSGVLVTGLRWQAQDLAANEQALLEGAREIAQVAKMAGGEQMHEAGEFVVNGCERVCDLLEHKRQPAFRLGQVAGGYSLHVGHSMGRGHGTTIAGSSVAEVQEQFEGIFGRTQEVGIGA
jgi:hypothetical protein